MVTVAAPKGGWAVPLTLQLMGVVYVSSSIIYDPTTGNLQECKQAGKAISMPPTAVLAELLVTVSFAMSHSVVQVADTDWVEPV